MPRPQVPKSAGFCKECPRYEEFRCVPLAEKDGKTDIIIVGDQPDSFSAANNWPFAGHGGRIVKTAVQNIKGARPEFSELAVKYTYAVQCASKTDTNPTRNTMNRCAPFLTSAISSSTPKIIIALGATAAKQLGFKQKFKSIRGKFLTYTNHNIPVLVTFAEKALLANTGLFETFKLDIRNAFVKALKEGNDETVTLEHLSQNYRIPSTVDEALQTCDEILDYGPGGNPDKHAISVDTETNTLYPEKETSKIIAFCFGWDKGKATTILYDHPLLDEEYRRRLPEVHDRLNRILAGPKPKIFHNAKFDIKFLEQRYNFKVNNVVWDTLLGEHLLDENKKGNYGLKALTAGWLPEYCGYEDKLLDILDNNEGISLVDLTQQEIDNIKDTLDPEHAHYLEDLRDYREKLAVYLKEEETYLREMERYRGALAGYEFAKAELEMLQRQWRNLVDKWDRSWGKKPIKPTKWFKKPTKPKKPIKPKKPKDPRSKKEQKISDDKGFENVPIYDLQVYGAVDADVTRQLTQLQRGRIHREKSKVSTLMRTHAIPASRTLGRMEYFGTRVDHDYIGVLNEALGRIIDSTEKEVYDMAGRTTPAGKPLNINHPLTLGNVVYNWGWTHPNGQYMPPFTAQDYTEKEQPSTAESALRAFIEYTDDNNSIPTDESYFIERVLTYRKANKAKNTFLSNIKALSKRDGFLHTQFHLNGTGTGRLSSSDMNMQNLPAWLAGWNIKKLFIPSDDTKVIVNADYKGAEVRVFTAYARDEKLIRALNEGLDMHSFFAHKVFDRPYEDYLSREDPAKVPDREYRKLLIKERSQIKRVVFGILYGAGPGKIAETIGVDKERAQELITLLFSMFPSIQHYIKEIDKEVVNNGFVETLFNRRRRFPLAGMRRHRNKAQRQARNFKIQSTSSDIVISQLVEVDEVLRREFDGRMLLTVHDSFVFEFPKKHITQLKDFLLEHGENSVRVKFPWLPVPFKMDIEVGPSYGEVQSLDEYISSLPSSKKPEGIVEENELITELKEDAFEYPKPSTVA